ncbi:carbon-nitrogen hydrolase family protein [Winogradskyella immobilis]|uniref:Carbon-nitrogen hydrolase family protein n=1 Tax=Winogradskyella immobilis TaxID=2816852 RepID=A0ABS8EQS1_9FLAO|nr:carbon-nitrogen hydrolase family protein [Winogradskyella immobilis]MCC1485231.1 carbon-nitrogen hydrolase family protein [Winogradskyella immobilis]MCG0017323.1 carbon-nitrogen hydrolase family protein [Winogradskyella immobilis]
MKVKVCLIQDSPVFFDKDKTIAKIENLVKTYAKQGCELIVFPESFIPGYPRGFSFGAVIGSRTDEGRALYTEYYNNSLDIESEDLKRLEKLSKTENVYLVIGATEKQKTNGSLYCSMLYISPTDGLLGTHRKIKPTGTERIIWGEANGDALVAFNTKIGKLGGLICWENYMPLARMSMYKKGVEIYIAPTADSRDEWTATMQHIALEGRCYVLGCNQFFTKSMYPERYKSLVKNEPENLCRGGSIIVSPLGKIIEGPLFDKAGALIAELDLDTISHSKLDFDVIGHYSRDDIFQFNAINQPDIIQEKDIKS